MVLKCLKLYHFFNSVARNFYLRTSI